MKPDKILLDHGSGGAMSHQLITETLLPAFMNPFLSQLHDGAVLEPEENRIAFSTDTFVVDPIFFPGGSIGDLAINGTVNDICMCGAVPKYLSVGLILEEGFAFADLERILSDMKRAAFAAEVLIVTGDTKVVPRGAVDKVFINTTGIGFIPARVQVAASRVTAGDQIILSGSMADHGMTILSRRENLSFSGPIKSDTAPLNHLVKKMIGTCPDIHMLRDPTRGGVGTTLNEVARSANLGMRIKENQLLVRDAVAGICDLLGIDPLYVANEGKLLAFVPPAQAEALIAVMQSDPLGAEARIIGEVINDHPGQVVMQTRIGGNRIVRMLTGEQLPRIC
ncbi:MAG: hydrogenase expression/formation protein HypE [Pseudomonadota bacterium]